MIFIWIAITVLIDVFLRRDISGWGKAAWVIFVYQSRRSSRFLAPSGRVSGVPDGRITVSGA